MTLHCKSRAAPPASGLPSARRIRAPRSYGAGFIKCRTSWKRVRSASRTPAETVLFARFATPLKAATPRSPPACVRLAHACILTVPGRNTWRHLPTTNIIESNFDPSRRRTTIWGHLRSGIPATNLVFALLVRRSDRWQRFNGNRILDDAYKQVTTRSTGATTIAKKKAT
jgi:hypothetical protein